MKKIEKVSIADISFTLDNDAYLSLKQYLDSLHKCYDKDPDGGEIIADIEARIAELILGEQVYTKVVGKQLIDTILAQLGTPQEIEDLVAETGRPTVQPVLDSSIPRRVYRSFEGRVFGGVCSGMAHYWNSSVTWFRLGFLAPFILFIITVPFDVDSSFYNFRLGFMWVFLVIYVMLWMAIPIAKTPRQKLESRGEKITPSSIRQNLQSSATTPSSKKAASVTAEVLTVLGQVVLFLIKLVVVVIAFGLLIGALSLLIAIIVMPFAAISDPTLDWLGNAPMVLLVVELVIFSVMIPLFAIGMALLSLVFSWKLGRWFYMITLGLWFVALIATIVLSVSNRKSINEIIRQEQLSHELLFFDNDTSNESRLLRDFIDRESRGGREITITAAGDSVVVSTLRNYPTDSLPEGSGAVLEYSKHIVLHDPEAVKEALEWKLDDKTEEQSTIIEVDGRILEQTRHIK
jgi:phage shock protein PspC (stress-responsive transcriptional regulator)